MAQPYLHASIRSSPYMMTSQPSPMTLRWRWCARSHFSSAVKARALCPRDDPTLTVMACTQHRQMSGLCFQDNFYSVLITFVLTHRGTAGGAASG